MVHERIQSGDRNQEESKMWIAGDASWLSSRSLASQSHLPPAPRLSLLGRLGRPGAWADTEGVGKAIPRRSRVPTRRPR